MKKWMIFVFLIIIFVAQFSAMGVFLKTRWIPNLFLAFAVSLALMFGFAESWGWIVICGLLMDAGVNWPLGSGTLILVAIAWLVDELKIIAELRSRRYIFLILLSLLFASSSLIFDFLLNFLIIFEKQLGISNVVTFDFRLNGDYLAKLVFSIGFGLVIYSFSRKIKAPRRAGILAR